jgi:hypothetical protein
VKYPNPTGHGYAESPNFTQRHMETMARRAGGPSIGPETPRERQMRLALRRILRRARAGRAGEGPREDLLYIAQVAKTALRKPPPP